MTGRQDPAAARAMQQFISRDAGQDQLFNYMMQLMTNYWTEGGAYPMSDIERNRIAERVRSQTHPRSEWRVSRETMPQVTAADLQPFERSGPGYTPTSPTLGPRPIVPGQGRGNRPIPTLDQYNALQNWIQTNKENIMATKKMSSRPASQKSALNDRTDNLRQPTDVYTPKGSKGPGPSKGGVKKGTAAKRGR